MLPPEQCGDPPVVIGPRRGGLRISFATLRSFQQKSVSELATPLICVGVTREGDRIRIATPVEFYYGNYPTSVPDNSTPLASPQDANYYLDLLNNGRWNGQIGRFFVDVDMTRGPGGITIFLGDTVSSGIMGGASRYEEGVIWLHMPTGQRGYDGLLADHELGHGFGNPHSSDLPGFLPGQAPNIMDALPSGQATESQVERLLFICRI